MRTVAISALVFLLHSGCASLTREINLWPGSEGNSASELPAQWDWATGIPTNAPRAELAPTNVPLDAVSHFVPQAYEGHMALAPSAPTLLIAEVNGKQVNNFKQLHAAITEAGNGQTAEIGLRSATASPEDPGIAVNVSYPTLISLSQATCPQMPLLRVTEDGNPWILVRQDGTRCTLMVRVERERGLLQVVGTLNVCWGAPAMLPVELRANCDGEPLQCLTIDDALDLLYGQDPNSANQRDENSFSFAAVSEQDGYLIPTKFKRLHQQITEESRRSVDSPPLPALATVQDVIYPGPAVLGDARAMTAFLLQKQIYRPGEAEHTGWALFAGPALRDGGMVELVIDLGRGPRSFEFLVPRQ